MTDDDKMAAMNEVMSHYFAKGDHYTADVVADGLALIKSQRVTIERQAATLAERDAEIAALRQIVSECASATGNGAFAKPDASVDFMACIPGEIAAVAKTREAEIARLRAGGWRPIDDEARNGEPWLIQTARERIFKAKWARDICVDEDGENVDAWAATAEDFHPPCWTDGVCWASNEDGVPSDPPVMYAPLPPTDTTETPDA